jgi:hypothetical protein
LDVVLCELGFKSVVAELADGVWGAVIQGWEHMGSLRFEGQVGHVYFGSVRGLDDCAVGKQDLWSVGVRQLVDTRASCLEKMACATGAGACRVMGWLGRRVGRVG